MRSIGIDLGTTHTVCAFADDDAAPELFGIPQVASGRTVAVLPQLPSFVFFPHESEGELPLPWDEARRFAVGTLAQERASAAPTRVIASAKSWLAHRTIDRRAPMLPRDAPPDVEKISPFEASWRYLEHLVEAYAHANPGRSLADEDVVLTVPASFDAAARELTFEAAFAAGLENVTLLEEPQAAVYAWIASRGDRFRKELTPGDLLLVVDVGGGTTDFSAITVKDVEGNLELERVAVGEHILLGGDNMDLALAHLVRQKLEAEGKDPNLVPMAALAHACRPAKERLLGDDPPAEVAVAIAAAKAGAKLVGGTLKTVLTRPEVERVIVEGFFPSVSRGARPDVLLRGGLTQIGLPYAHDAAVTKHLASFLGRQGKLRPTCILFSGGVMKSAALRSRVKELVDAWLAEGSAPAARVLEGADYDGAVAKGAAAYGHARKTNGIRIRGGTARAYYVGIEEAAPAVPGIAPRVNALCIAPIGMEEGMTADVTDAPGDFSALGVVVGETVRFRFFGSTVRKDDRAGSLLSSTSDLEELSPIDVRVPSEGRDEGDVVPVRLRAIATAIGTLELEAIPLVPRVDGEKFVLELNVREAASGSA
ncbi:Hsp70 family protein [soil metagenome]